MELHYKELGKNLMSNERSPSQTPRTDKVRRTHILNCPWVRADDMEELEIELNNVKRQLEKVKQQLKKLKDQKSNE